jgi:hypothetical protein
MHHAKFGYDCFHRVLKYLSFFLKHFNFGVFVFFKIKNNNMNFKIPKYAKTLEKKLDNHNLKLFVWKYIFENFYGSSSEKKKHFYSIYETDSFFKKTAFKNKNLSE